MKILLLLVLLKLHSSLNPTLLQLPCNDSQIRLVAETKLNDCSGVMFAYQCGTNGYIQKLSTDGNFALVSLSNLFLQTFCTYSQSIQLSGGNIVLGKSKGSSCLVHGIMKPTGEAVKEFELYQFNLIRATGSIAAIPSGGYVMSWVKQSPELSLNFQEFSGTGFPNSVIHSSQAMNGLSQFSAFDVFSTSEDIIFTYNKGNSVYFRIFSKTGAVLCDEYQASSPDYFTPTVYVKTLSDSTFVICWGLDGFDCSTYKVAYSPTCTVTKLSSLPHIKMDATIDCMKLIKHSRSNYALAYLDSFYFNVILYSVSGTLLISSQVATTLEHCNLHGEYTNNVIVLGIDNVSSVKSYYALFDVSSVAPPSCSNYNFVSNMSAPFQLDFSPHAAHLSMSLKLSFSTLPGGGGKIFRTGDTTYTSIDLHTSYLLTELSYLGGIGITQATFEAIGDDAYLSEALCTLTLMICYSHCETCTAIPGTSTDHQCDKCASSYYPFSDYLSNCEQNIEPGYLYYYFNTTKSMFQRCYNTCLKCAGDGTSMSQNCIQCLSNTEYLYETNCLITCPVYTYVNDSSLTCVNCKSLNQFYFQGSCIATIPPNSWLVNSAFNAYEECYVSCETCTGVGNASNNLCITCRPSFYLKSDQLTQCLDTPLQYYYLNSVEKMIKPCYETCMTCFADGTAEAHQCESCKPGLYQFGKNCLVSCPTYSYVNEKTCVNCKLLGQYFFNGTCVTTIKDNWQILNEEYNAYYEPCKGLCCEGYFYNSNTKKCIACTSPCKTCSNEISCLSCIQTLNEKYYLYQSTCVNLCPEGTYYTSEQNICINCNPSCAKCINNSTYCVECASSASFQLTTTEKVDNIDRQCLATCPANYYPDISNKCILCSGEGYVIKDGKCVIAYLDCLDAFGLDNPTIVDLALKKFFVNIVFTLKSDCSTVNQSLLKSSASFKWKNLYGGTLENNNKTLVLNTELFDEGEKVFEVDMLVNNTTMVSSVSPKSYFKKYKLVPVVANENNLTFINGFDVIVDASQSYDEASNSEIQSLNFTWSCPSQFQANCSTTTENILTIKPIGYKDIDPLKTFTGTIVLTLRKNSEKITKSLTITISPSGSNSTNSSTVMPSLENLIQISQKSREGDDIIFGITLDSALNELDFTYKWTIDSIISNDVYLNGREESCVKIKSSSLKNDESIIELQIKRKSDAISFTKKYPFKKVQAPYGGSCVVNPNAGDSLVTNFTFVMEDWKSEQTPLLYKIYASSDGKEISLTNEYILDKKFSTWKTPVTEKVFLNVMDFNKAVITVPCNVQIRKSANLNLNAMMNNVYNSQEKMLLLECYNTNSPLNTNMTSQALDILMGANTSQPTSSVLNLLEIGSKAQDKASQMKVFSLTASIASNAKSFASDNKKMTSLFTTMNNNLQGSSSQEPEFISKIDNLMMDTLSTVQQAIIPGEVKQIETESFLLKVAKFSPLNTKSFSVSTEPNGDQKSCSTNSVICLDQKKLGNLSTKSRMFGVTAIYNKDNKFKVNISTFSTDSLEFYVSDSSTGRRLEMENTNYTVNLNIKDLDKNSTKEKVGDTLCMQYKKDGTYDAESCQTWYDYESNMGVCICDKDGLIVNILDKTFSSVNKMKQFPVPSAKLCIDGFLVGLVVILITIVMVRDKKDRKKLFTKTDKYFDPKHYVLMRLKKENFHLSYSFGKLYVYMMKLSHPIGAVMSLYSPEYSRVLRIMDFIIKIHLSFFFGLLPYYYTTNEEFELVKSHKNIQNRGKTVDDYEAKVAQIVNGAIYSVAASIISALCTILLNLIIHRDIGREEAQRIATSKRLLIEDVKGVKSYQRVLHNIKIKMRFLLLIGKKKKNCIFNEEAIALGPGPSIRVPCEEHEKLGIEHSWNDKLLKQTFSIRDENSNHLVLTLEGEMFEKAHDIFDIQIVHEIQLEIKSPTSNQHLRFVYLVNSRIRSFEHIGKESEISGNFYSILAIPKEPKLSILFRIRSYLKFILALFILVFIWYYIAVFALTIYENFGNNFFKICVMPLISMLFIQLVIVAAAMMLISCILMTLWGKSIPAIKKFSIKKLIYNGFVTPFMNSHYQAILSLKTMLVASKANEND